MPPSWSDETIFRVDGPQGIVAAIPNTLGFTPRDSLVVACIAGSRHRVGPVMRVDNFPEHRRDVSEQLIRTVLTYADAVSLLCYHDGPLPACVQVLQQALIAADVPVWDVLSIQDGRIRDATTIRDWTTDPGIPVLDDDDPQLQQLRYAHALNGRQTLRSREELAASIRPGPGAKREVMRDALADAEHSLAHVLNLSGRSFTVELSHLVDEVLDHALAEQAATGSVTEHSAARLIVLVQHVGCRDQLLARVVTANSTETIAAMVTITALCPDDVVADVASVLAAAACRNGNGALAHCALDRAEQADPEHRLTMLLRVAAQRGMHPDEFAHLADIPLPAGPPRTSSRHTAGY